MNSFGKRENIRIVHGLARCGGTMLNRCLGSMQDTIILSELNPRHSINPLLYQSLNWFGMISKWDTRLLRAVALFNRKAAFRLGVKIVAKHCRDSGKHLVIRDWNHPDFIGYPFDLESIGKSSCLDLLSKNFTCISASIVRHPIDQYLSSIKRKGLKDLDIATFLNGYCKFASFASRGYFIRFEDFTNDPASVLKSLCDALEIEYDDNWQDNWHNYWKVTGDSDQPEKSRGIDSSQILPLKRRSYEPELEEQFESHPNYRECIKMLGYN